LKCFQPSGRQLKDLHIKNGSKNATLPFKKTSDDKLFQGHQKQQTDTINRMLFENASSPVFAFFSKIIRFYFIGMFPDFLDTLYLFF
jgi:hypothetical protein